jgi:protein translocase SecG subunit
MLDMLKFAEIFIAILLIFVILIQNKNVSLNLSNMSWWMWEVTKRWPEKVLHNVTIVFWTLFILNSMALFLLSK